VIKGSHRSNAEDARAAAAASELPNVRERHLRSADAHDAAATREEQNAANHKRRVEEGEARRAAVRDAAEDDGSRT